MLFKMLFASSACCKHKVRLMGSSDFDNPIAYSNHMFAALKHLRDLEEREFRGVITAMLNPTLRERIVTLNYHRAAFNVETILALPNSRHFQGIAMMARAVFEDAVELKLISLNPDAAEKVDAVTRIERLRAAEDVVAFKNAHPEIDVHTGQYQKYVDNEGAAIKSEQQRLWRGTNQVNHWLNKKMGKRIEGLGEPFERIYEAHYPQLSWYSHPGVTGVWNVSGEMLAAFVGICYQIAVESYMQILEILVNEFRLYVHDDKLKDKIQYAKFVAFARSQEEADAVMRVHGLG